MNWFITTAAILIGLPIIGLIVVWVGCHLLDRWVARQDKDK